MSDIDLSIIIPVYNNVNFTRSCVLDLLKLPSNHEIIVVNNNSSDDTPIVLNELQNKQYSDGASLVWIDAPRNLGFGRGNNKGYKHSRGKNVMFLNNDIRVVKNYSIWTEKYIKAAQDGNLVAAHGGYLDSNFNFLKEVSCYESDEKMVSFPYFYLSGWCISASRETFDKLILDHYCDDKTDEMKDGKAWGPWNEIFTPAYFEDDDLSWRARKQGIKLLVKGNSDVRHFGRMTSKKMDLSKMYLQSQLKAKKIWQQELQAMEQK